MATNAMLAVNEIAESIVYKKLTVSIHRRCLLSSENEKEQAAKLTQCIDKSYACCLLSLKKRMIAFSRKPRRTHILSVMVYKCALSSASGKIKLVQSEKIHLNSKRYVRTYQTGSDFYFRGTYVHAFFTWNENILFSLRQRKRQPPDCHLY